MIAITDYGMGNLRSVQKALERLGAQAVITSEPAALEKADKVILPGVGAFGDAMGELQSRGLLEPLKRAAREKPFFGVCLGLQLLFTESEEGGLHEGLNLIPGRVVRFRPENLPGGQSPRLKVPHMGWNSIQIAQPSPLFQGLETGDFAYFVHSYYGRPEDSSVVAAWTHYGIPFASAIASGKIFATQFHPEKSQAVGLRMLENFINI